ncbi:hypothetical protein LXL04_027782 [Taraxacum kok-saghyz]
MNKCKGKEEDLTRKLIVEMKEADRSRDGIFLREDETLVDRFAKHEQNPNTKEFFTIWRVIDGCKRRWSCGFLRNGNSTDFSTQNGRDVEGDNDSERKSDSDGESDEDVFFDDEVVQNEINVDMSKFHTFPFINIGISLIQVGRPKKKEQRLKATVKVES